MATFLDDQFNRSGFLNSSSASPTGGTWSSFVTGNGGAGNASLDGSSATAGSSEITSFINTAVAGAIEATVTLTFTPTDDNWIAGVVFHGDSDGYPSWICYASSSTRQISRITSSSDAVGTNVVATLSDSSIAAGNRTQHTLAVSVASNGNITVSVDGSGVSFGTVNDANLTTAGRCGVFARSISWTSLVGADGVGGGGSATGAAMHYYRQLQG